MTQLFVDELVHLVPILDQSSNPATGVLGTFVDLKNYEAAEFIIHVGTLGTADYTFKPQCSAVTAGTTATDLPFTYRKSAAAGTDSMGDPTAVAAASGIAMLNASDSDKLLLIDIQGSDVVATVDAKPFVGIYATRAGGATATISIDVLLKPRFPRQSQINAFA